MPLVDLADQKRSRFISRTSGNFHQSGIHPKLLSFLKINTVLPLVLCVRLDEVPSAQYAGVMVVKARQPYVRD